MIHTHRRSIWLIVKSEILLKLQLNSKRRKNIYLLKIKKGALVAKIDEEKVDDKSSGKFGDLEKEAMSFEVVESCASMMVQRCQDLKYGARSERVG